MRAEGRRIRGDQFVEIPRPETLGQAIELRSTTALPFPPLHRGEFNKSEPAVDERAGRGRIKQRSAGLPAQNVDAFAHQATRQAAPPPRRIDDHHGDVAEALVGQRGGGRDQSFIAVE